MTGFDLNTTTLPSRSESPNEVINRNRTSQQHQDTPRARRFSEKLINAAKKSPLARFPLQRPTPSTSSSSQSPPLDYDKDDESIGELSSCFSSPQRDDQELNRHLQDLMLSPFRSDNINDLALYRALSPESSTSTKNSTTPTRRKIRDKRSNKQQQHISDSPSLSAKPKRRKLKQQRTSSWRMGADATLDTTTVHYPSEQHQYDNQERQKEEEERKQTRRSSRIASQKQEKRYSDDDIRRTPKTPVVLGTPGGVRSEKMETEWIPQDGDDDDDIHPHQRTRRLRRRTDIIEERLDRLITARDPLDLSHHSVLPKKSSSPVMITLDDSDDDHDMGLKKIKMEPTEVFMDLSSPPPSSPLETTATKSTERFEKPLETTVVDLIDVDEDITLTPAPLSTTVNIDEEIPPKQIENIQHIEVATETSPVSKTAHLMDDNDKDEDMMDTDILTSPTTPSLTGNEMQQQPLLSTEDLFIASKETLSTNENKNNPSDHTTATIPNLSSPTSPALPDETNHLSSTTCNSTSVDDLAKQNDPIPENSNDQHTTTTTTTTTASSSSSSSSSSSPSSSSSSSLSSSTSQIPAPIDTPNTMDTKDGTNRTDQKIPTPSVEQDIKNDSTTMPICSPLPSSSIGTPTSLAASVSSIPSSLSAAMAPSSPQQSTGHPSSEDKNITTVSTTTFEYTNKSAIHHDHPKQVKDMYSFLANDATVSIDTTTNLDKQSLEDKVQTNEHQGVPTSSSTDTTVETSNKSSIGSSIFGQMFDSVSHYFLGN
ncbi:uncharacterized protein BX664DRAFT_342555 [Halteromyces radiatus]|uniref:uncharacterized protein n=1 Tax=Halteromyces radiatus TaxID=101107 RepID=UPI00221ED004|nr:uncharacterized protein BX664DRAFT_342555 [Halteromyces radiatus]KAI8078723.1 hypothetical protein BX664DRAFT_342555 [Halteromyces radiatus]